MSHASNYCKVNFKLYIPLNCTFKTFWLFKNINNSIKSIKSFLNHFYFIIRFRTVELSYKISFFMFLHALSECSENTV